MLKDAVQPIDEELRTLQQPLVELIHEHHGHLSPARRASAEVSWLARIRAQRRRWQTRAAWAGVALASSVAAYAVAIATLHRAPAALRVDVMGAHLVREGTIEPDTGNTPLLHFSDGSDVRLSSGASASLRQVDDHGATIAVRNGNAEVDITHRPGARWAFEVGPFVINVTGTAFRFAWNPGSEEFDLLMQRGTVEVTGPLTNGAIVLRAGEHLVVRVRRGEAVIREHDAEDAADAAAPPYGPMGSWDRPIQEPAARATAPGPATAGAAAAPAGGSERGLASSARPESVGEQWPALLKSGAFEAIVADAHRRGLDTTLAHAGPSELAALADAARYTRDDDVARRTLLAERERFPGSTLAREASFLLGRLEETRNDSSAAIDCYRRYLNEDPGGRYVSEALGRTMVLLAATSPDSARPVAEEYLRRFPSGAYAARASALAKAP